jgi:hypothetical protein
LINHLRDHWADDALRARVDHRGVQLQVIDLPEQRITGADADVFLGDQPDTRGFESLCASVSCVVSGGICHIISLDFLLTY